MSAENGPELARAALDAALSAQRQKPRRPTRSRRASSRGGFSGAGADARDPQPFGKLIGDLVRDRGWEEQTAQAAIFARWSHLVGQDISAHCHPVSLRESELTVQAESTTWATQLRMLTSTLLKKLRDGLGRSVVSRIRIHGPAAPSWQRGPLSVRGRGPRDTYG